MLRLAIDIGGTFTDVALYDAETGDLTTTKHLTTASEPVLGVLEGVDAVLAQAGRTYADLGDVTHATTLATNTVLERDGDRVGLITTEGFSDILTLQRQKRFELYDFTAKQPTPLVRPEDIRGVVERIGADGSEVSPLDEAAVRAAAEEFRAQGIKAVAVCFLNSFVAPEHERRAKEIVLEVGDFLVSCSHEVAPVIREFERFSTCVMNAYVQARIAEYLNALDSALTERGFTGTFYIMQSSGGLVDAETARQQPVRLIESGPAAGVIAAARTATEERWPAVLSFDMGGTTAKLCLIEDGVPTLTHLLEVDRNAMKPRSGLPLMMPAVDLVEIGTGGGSIAGPRMGAIAVGPTSAGAEPGPACYGLGGTSPTVTDSNAALGIITHLNADFGIKMLDVDASRAAIRTHLAEPLGFKEIDAAAAVRAVAVADMANAARLVTTERGHDPRDAVLFALGGAGPMHAVSLAEELGISKVAIPPQAGVGSAIGLFVADIVYSSAVSKRLVLNDDNEDALREILQGLVAANDADVRARVGARADELEISFEADLRFVGQGHEIAVPFEQPDPSTPAWKLVHDRFVTRYRASYPNAWLDRDVEAITWHVHYRLRGQASLDARATTVPDTAETTRQCYFGGEWQDTAIVPWNSPTLRSGVAGPAIIEQDGSTVVVPPNWTATVDSRDLLLLSTDTDSGRTR